MYLDSAMATERLYAKSEYSVRRSGRPFTDAYRVYFERAKDRVPVSPFHDIPLYHDEDAGVLNMVVEVPRWTNAKFEVRRSPKPPVETQTLTSLPDTPTDTDQREPQSHQPRHAAQETALRQKLLPIQGLHLELRGSSPGKALHNHHYTKPSPNALNALNALTSLGQTWEDPNHKHPDTHAKGDDDPLDVCEIGRAIAKTGDVKQVKVLGILGLLDSGETDWKVIAIDVHDPLADKLHGLEDVEEHLPGLLDATRDWFRIYMVPDGYPPNEYAFDGEFRDKTWVGRAHYISGGTGKRRSADRAQVCRSNHQRVRWCVEKAGPRQG